MGSIYKRGRNWYIDVRVKGRRIRKRVGPSKDIAKLALKDAEVKAARDEFGFAKDDISIDKFIERFLDYSRANHQPATTNRYRAVIDHFQAFLKSLHGVTFISEVTAETIDRYKVYRKDAWVNPNGQPVESDDDVNGHTRKGARGHTINFEVGTLRTIFNLAIKWGYLKDNPARGITKLKVNDSKSQRFLSKEECQRLLDACPEQLYPVYFTFLNTGMRKAELENLEWSDIDFKRRKIKIRRKEDWQPKTGEREIPISDSLLDLLQSLKDKNTRTVNSDYVFCHKDGGKLRTKLREKLISIAKKAEIEDLTRVHTLRHTFASHLVMSGVDLPTVKKLMGHSDIQTTMIYAHLAPDHLADAVNKLSF
ncbi:MAG: site-specific integrase [candidate division Zixibacteria bacterium]|nr:site-specific integrase [candidate division Zixibacteria bacterium]